MRYISEEQLQYTTPERIDHYSDRAYSISIRCWCLCLLTTLLCTVASVAADDTPSSAVAIAVNSSATGEISPEADVDYWRFVVPSRGQLVVETSGDTDTVGALEDDSGNRIDFDDDSGTEFNFKIAVSVDAGTYYIRVSGYDFDETGPYTLHVQHIPEVIDSDTPENSINPPLAFGDFDGDGRDDVLLRHDDGRWFYYPMNGKNHIPARRGLADLTRKLAWQVAGIGDLNGDGKDDVLLRHEDGRWFYYPMNGRRHITGERGLADLTRKLDWQVAGIGDLNGDGKDDVLLRHTDGRWFYYPMNGRRHITGERGLAGLTRKLDWQVAGIGDLNGDGKDDVLLRHTDGRWFYYPMSGRRPITSQRGLADLTRKLDWQVAGIGDFNGDGKDDVLLRNEDGRWFYYPMSGRRHIVGERGLADLTRNLAWQVAGIGDLNGDGRDDVLVRNEDGRWFYYPMSGRLPITSQRGLADLTRNLAWTAVSGGSATAPVTIPQIYNDNLIVLPIDEIPINGASLDVRTYAQSIYAWFDDSFDYLMFFLNLPDRPDGIPFFGQYHPVSNDTQGIGEGIFFDNRYGSAGKLRGALFFPYNRALLNGPSLHELMHSWANYTIPTAVGAHWGFSSANGQLGGFDLANLVDLGGGQYTTTDGFGTIANGGNSLPFSSIELYFAGLIAPEEVPDLWVAEDGEWLVDENNSLVRSEYETRIFTADFRIYTIDDIIAEHGARVPDWTESQKHFRAAVVLLTDENHPATLSQQQAMSEQVSKFSYQGDDDSHLFNYYEATGGRGSITMDGLSQFRKNMPTGTTSDMPASFGVLGAPIK